jgi:hypothetical protein
LRIANCGLKSVFLIDHADWRVIFIRIILTPLFYPGNIQAMNPYNDDLMPSCTAFLKNERVASGAYANVALVVKTLQCSNPTATVLIFDDQSGKQIDFDLRGTEQEVVARLADHLPKSGNNDAVRGRGRPKLGVVAREVTLLPRHWDWLATQSGGASVALRKLVDEARRACADKDKNRNLHERTYHFMSAMAGNLPGFEESARALFASDWPRFRELIDAWPQDIRDHLLMLAFGGKTNEIEGLEPRPLAV